MIIKCLGWFATTTLVYAGFPQLRRTLRDGHARGMEWGYLSSLLIGFVSMTLYAILSNAPVPMIVSYSVQIVVFSTIALFKIFPRKNS